MPLQLAKPALQEATLQTLFEHAAVPLAALQTLPQAPQLFTLTWRLVSQPSLALPLQLAKPALQEATLQTLFEHAAVPLAALQTLPQAPQLFTLTWRLVSQPSLALPLQLAKPALQEATLQTLFEHAAVPLAALQTLPQAPQLFTLTWRLVSQPSLALPLQLAKPALQEATLQTLFEHAAVPLAALQTLPQAPQLFTLTWRLVSQPSLALPLQLAKPALQEATLQTLFEHAAVPLAALQTLPQAPQLFTLTWRLVSQPSLALPLQLAKPALQEATLQTLFEHAAVPLAALQTLPQAPQLLTLLVRLVSQPSLAMPL